MADNQAVGADSALPAYLPYKTLRTFLDMLRADGIPQRIDKSMMRSMSGTAQNQLMHGLRALNLMDKNGTPLPNLQRLVDAESNERQQVLREILEEAYPTILGPESGGFRLDTTTTSMLHEKFNAFGAKPDTTRKAETFFLHAAKDANIPISKRIVIRQRASPSRSGSGRSSKSSGSKGSGETPQRDAPGGNAERPPSDLRTPPPSGLDTSTVNPRYKLLLNMLEILPEDGIWEDEEELENWLEAVTATLRVRTKVRRTNDEEE